MQNRRNQMTSMTVTITEDSVKVPKPIKKKSAIKAVNLKVKSKSKEAFAFEKLVSIFETYSRWTDVLSKSIFVWGKQLIIDFAAKDLSKTATYDEAFERVEFLRNQILVDSVLKQPLRNPKMDGDWIFEESFLAKFEKKYGEPFPCNAIRTHEFAKEMIAWISSLSSDSDCPRGRKKDPFESKEKELDSDSPSTLTVENEKASLSCLRDDLFSGDELTKIVFAQRSFMLEKQNRQAVIIKQQTEAFVNLRKEAESLNIRMGNQFSVEVDNFKQSTRIELDENRRIYGEQIKVIKLTLDEQIQELNRAKASIKNNENIITGLRSEVVQLRRNLDHRKQEVHELVREVDKLKDKIHDGSCVIL
jgi:hypothetical protein